MPRRITPEQLLTALVRHARERVLLDPRWEALALGTLDAAGRAELEERAKTSREYALGFALFAPLSSAFRERVTQLVATRLAALPVRGPQEA